MLTHEFAVGPVGITAAIAGAVAIVRSSTDTITSGLSKAQPHAAKCPVIHWPSSEQCLKDHTLISIADDDALARDGIRELVESLGYKARSFISAEHFLESDVIAETACLITDLQMPGLNGLELQEALRSQGCCVPIILITAFPDDKHRNRALEGGALGFLSKPFDEVSLIQCLAAATRLRTQ